MVGKRKYRLVNSVKFEKIIIIPFILKVFQSILGESASIFTSIFYNHYSAPNGFDFELNSNYKALDVSSFSQYARSHAKAFRTNHIFVPMGDDFRYMNARKYFDKIDELIK